MLIGQRTFTWRFEKKEKERKKINPFLSAMALLIFFVPIKIPQKSIHKSKTNETQSDSFTSRSDSLRKTSHLNNSWTWFNVLLGLARLTGRLLASLEFHGLGFYFCLALCWVSRTTSTSSLDHETVSQFWVRLLQRVSFLITERRKEEEGGGGWLVGWLVGSVGWMGARFNSTS